MNRSNVEEIKSRLSIADVVGQYVKLEKAGSSFKARCPFHNEKSASFFVSPDRGGYYCFGCGAKGDIFTFVEQFEGLDFRGALKVLAERAGVKLTFDAKADGERDQFFKIMEEATEYYQNELAKNNEATEYVKSRGITDETKKEFRIGFAPEGWRNVEEYLKKKGWKESLIEKAGLIKPSDKNNQEPRNNSQTGVRYYDRFRGRIMFPITDSSGRVIAFSGRILKDDGQSAKYLNSPDTPLFDKSQTLFGLDKAKSEIRRLNYSILVEGQMDLVLSHQAGVKNTVAASGTALTDTAVNEQGIVTNLGLVRRLSPNIIIALDSDAAGRKAAMRAVAATALGMGMSVKIADIEGGKDPADLIKSDPESWRQALRHAKHVVEYELGNVIREVPDNRKQAAAIRERVFPFLVRIDSEMDKAYYVKMIAEKLGVGETAVWEDLRKQEAESRKKEAGKNQQSITNNQETLLRPGSGGQAITKQIEATAPVHRLDLIERRLFGLLTLMESDNDARASEYRREIEKISGSSWEMRLRAIESIRSDLAFEAEAFFGADRGRWDVHMRELIFNFEEDMVGADLILAMQELRTAEQKGDQKALAEIAKKCQVLSLRKAEIAKRRRG